MRVAMIIGFSIAMTVCVDSGNWVGVIVSAVIVAAMHEEQ